MLTGIGAALDVGMYIIAFGSIAIMAINRWLPAILAKGIPEIALQNVVARMCTIAIFLAGLSLPDVRLVTWTLLSGFH